MKPVVLIAFAVLLLPQVQASTVLPPAVLSSGPAGEGQTELTWDLPGPADQIHLHTHQDDGVTITTHIAGNAASYTTPPGAGVTFTMTYTFQGDTSVTSNPAPGYPNNCEKFLHITGGVPPVVLSRDCWCPMPVVDHLVCNIAAILFD